MFNNDYNFPFTPYPSQKELMKKIFETIDESKIGIFESPTGTGKSLCVICSVLSWILQNEYKETARLIELKKTVSKSNEIYHKENDWIEAYNKKRKLNNELEEDINILTKREEVRLWIKQIKKGHETDAAKEKKILNLEINNDEFILDYDSDTVDEEVNKEMDSESIIKVFYCSRTHSQLSQFVKELQKTDFYNNIVLTNLASRKVLCINKEVNHNNRPVNLINDKCLDMQKKTGNGCCNFKTNVGIQKLTEAIIKKSPDIENVLAISEKLKACPFYASRKALPFTHLVLLPYQNLLNPAARKASGINVKNNIVVIDEAHNLADSITDVNSVKFNIKHIIDTRKLIDLYLDRYMNKLANKNLHIIRQIYGILTNMLDFLEKSNEFSLSVVEFLFNSSLNTYQFYEILKFIDLSKFAFKLYGFVKNLKDKTEQKLENDDENITENSKKSIQQMFGLERTEKTQEEHLQENLNNLEVTSNPVLLLRNFFEAIYFNVENSAKILYDKGGYVQFLVVNPSKYMKDLIDDARSIVVLGGTMKPFSDFIQLFEHAPLSRLELLSCEHVINPIKQLKVIPISRDFYGNSLRFTVNDRKDGSMLKHCGKMLCQLLKLTPNGSVVFLPSFAALTDLLTAELKNELSTFKAVFIESRTSHNLDKILSQYSIAARRDKGAVIFGVVGGKLSEGINFDDELARLVCIVGLPYPDKSNIVLKEKMQFIESRSGSSTTWYSNLAMKAVNQSIGRAIRHINDYAIVMLIDSRYSSIIVNNDNKKLGLPDWMKPAVISLDNNNNENYLQEITNEFHNFFRVNQ